jgi:hypothetical protein
MAKERPLTKWTRPATKTISVAGRTPAAGAGDKSASSRVPRQTILGIAYYLRILINDEYHCRRHIYEKKKYAFDHAIQIVDQFPRWSKQHSIRETVPNVGLAKAPP